MAITYSSNFLMYFFLGALSSNCKPSHSILLLLIHSVMSDPNYNTRPIYIYPHADNQQYTPSQSYIRNNQDAFTPTHSRIELANTQFVPKIIESGYIVGPPVAYTQAPNLPPNFQAFSPVKSTVPIILDNSVRGDFASSSSKVTFTHPSHLYPVEMKPPPPSIVIHSPSTRQEETVSKALYDRTLMESRNWETRYNQLQVKYSGLLAGQGQSGELHEENRRLRQRVRELEQRERTDSKNIKELIEKYKESTLKQCYLLLDRYRLQCKQRE